VAVMGATVPERRSSALDLHMARAKADAPAHSSEGGEEE
jgi:hypothetical protein